MNIDRSKFKTDRIQFDDYAIVINGKFITYDFYKKNICTRIFSEFNITINDYSKENFLKGIHGITIENSFMKFRCENEFQEKQMFDFIGKGFDIFKNAK